MSNLQSTVDKIVQSFDLPKSSIDALVKHFVELAELGLESQSDKGMPMIPTFVTSVPTGEEKGIFLAADLGGTNFRVCSVALNGDSTFDIQQKKWPIPPKLMVGTSEEFFSYLAEKVHEFLTYHMEDPFAKDGSDSEKTFFRMGFTFSFPVFQTDINRGKLIRWTKGFDIKDAVDKDICELFQHHLDVRNIPVHIAALVNDTVGTLMTRAYTSAHARAKPLIGAIFGTGTNGAYSEQIKSIPKFNKELYPKVADKNIMLINTEWGSFDNSLELLPNTKYDVEIDALTPNPGYHMFEKRVSGMFLGELLRLILVDLKSQNLIFKGVESTSKLTTPWSFDTSVSSHVEADETKDFSEIKSTIQKAIDMVPTEEECSQIKKVVHAIGKRSAYLSAVPLAGLIVRTKALDKFDQVDIGVDGSVVEFYPNFEKMIREALSLSDAVGEHESRIKIGVAKDGSGVGAALCALVA
ncbi:hypothetical protein NADFUDRAFT_51298 [Nadsonia fulvescens var. elongata DSM 6958]|uniref:Phosphotransferase n=1 Tax=Nadsonia fulvescens var. elongata DSM 6958 TaxID=857566 RepID=A0A1E3PL19_9ASCO|nr:hypothetical protein NADFUDRAFT_51298 [Nadsonia fulvescens var. elongata DSM 6958]